MTGTVLTVLTVAAFAALTYVLGVGRGYRVGRLDAYRDLSSVQPTQQKETEE